MGVKFLNRKGSYLERAQRNGWHRRCIVVEGLRSGSSTLKLNMSTETLRCELHIALLDVIYDTLGNIQDAFGRIRIHMIDSSDGQ